MINILMAGALGLAWGLTETVPFIPTLSAFVAGSVIGILLRRAANAI